MWYGPERVSGAVPVLCSGMYTDRRTDEVFRRANVAVHETHMVVHDNSSLDSFAIF